MATMRTGGESWKADKQREYDITKAALATFPAPDRAATGAHEELGGAEDERRVAVNRMRDMRGELLPGGVPSHRHPKDVASAREGMRVQAQASAAPRPEMAAQRQEAPQTEQPPLDPPPPPDLRGIPTTSDRWKSQDEWARFQRHYETEQGKLTIRTMREAARRQRQQLAIYDKRISVQGSLRDAAIDQMNLDAHRATFLAGQGDEAVRRSNVEADLLMQEMGLAAHDQRRIAENAALAMEFHQEQAAEAEIQTEAQVEQREAQIEIVTQDAQQAMLDTNLATDRANAEAAVLSAARGAGGSLIEQQETSREAQRTRQLGRIGARSRSQTKGIRASIKEVESRGKIAKAAAVLSRKRAARQKQGAEERRKLIEDTDDIRANEIRTAGLHEEARLDIQSAQAAIASTRSGIQSWVHETNAHELGLDKEATRVNAELSEHAANLGVASLRDRPPIPDWIEIGKDAKKAQQWQTAGGIVSLFSAGLNLVSKIFKIF